MAEEERDRKWTVLRLRGLRKRWIVNTILPVLVLLMLLVTLVSVGVSTYYYSSMENGLMKQAEAMSSAFNDYFMNSYSEYNQMATQAVDTYEDKSRIELQFIGSTGRIQMSTSGLTAGSSPGTSDITRAITNQEITPFQGRDPETGEKIMAVSAPLLFNGRVAGVMRLVTSMKLVDRQIVLVVFIILAVGGICMALVLISSLLFINNVVEPVAVVSEAAKRISAGSYGFQIENKYTDELGELVDNINDMSLKISQSEKIQQEFVSSVSHELRTPITVILAECDRAKRKAYTRGDFLESVGVIEQQSEHMSQLVQALLGLTRMEHGTDKYPIKRMDLSALVCSCCEECPPPPGSHAEVELDIQPDIQAACNAGLMSRVVVNLLQNAYKYGGEQVRVRVSLHENADGKAVLRVADDGPGIAPEDQDKVWQRFWQADPSRGEDGGSGLGLAMVKEIVQLHGGSVGLESTPGKGSIFSVTL